MLHLGEVQLHMLSQNRAGASEALASCQQLLVQAAQQPEQQPIAGQLQLHFCILRVLSLLSDGRHVELQQAGEPPFSVQLL